MDDYPTGCLNVVLQEDLYSILTEPVTNLIRQQVELLQSEGVHLSFSDGAIREIARVSFVVSHPIERSTVHHAV